MEEAPSPLPIDINVKNERKSFEKNNFKIFLEKNNLINHLIIKIIFPNGINIIENSFSYEEMIKLVKPFIVNGNIDELYTNLVELFNIGEYEIIPNEDGERVEISLLLFNNKGTKEKYSLILKQTQEDSKEIQKLMIKKIMELENKNEKLTEENKKSNEEIINLKKEIEKINSILSANITNINKELTKNVITFDSKIITDFNEMKFIFDKIENQSNKKIKKLELLYRATEHNGLGSIFHQKCNDKTPTIVIIHSKNNYIFGGFTEKSWSSRGFDDNAFCFSINLKKIYNIIKGKEAIWSGGDNGPIFQGNHNFIQIGREAFAGGNHSCDKTSNYEGVEEDYEISGGVNYFSLEDYEVFQIIF